MKKIVFLFIVVLSFNIIYAQKVITMTNINGMYTLYCKINGVPSNMLFNPGVEKVIIPIETASYLRQNGIIGVNDISSNDGNSLNIRELEIEGIVIKNISAIISSNYSGAPVLGQSAINKLGQYRVDGNHLVLLDFKTDKSYAISYGDKWLDKNSLYKTLENNASRYAEYLGLKGDQRIDFVDRLNDIIRRLWDGGVRFCKSGYDMALCGIRDDYGFYYNKYGKRLEKERRGQYVDIGQYVINFMLESAKRTAEWGTIDINGVIINRR